jgi:primosomal protein N' (replication factor Y)
LESLLDQLERNEHGALARAPVVLAVALDQSYDYLVPEGLDLEPGCFVLVPFGPQSRIGVVWDAPVGEPGKAIDPKKLKSIAGRLDVPPLPPISLKFAEWMRATRSPLGMVVRMMMCAPAVFEPARPRFGVTRNEGAGEPARMTPARKRVLRSPVMAHPRQGGARRRGGVFLGVIDGLVASGNLVEVAIPEKRLHCPTLRTARPSSRWSSRARCTR